MAVPSKPRVRFKPFLALDVDRLDALKYRLQRDGARVVARWLIAEYPEFKGYTQAGLATQVTKFRKEVVFGGRWGSNIPQQLLERRVPKAMAKIDVLDYFATLVTTQRGRLDKVLENEARTPLALRSVGQEVDLMRNLLKDLAGIYIEVGILPRAPTTVRGLVLSEVLDGAKQGTMLVRWDEGTEQAFDDLDIEGEFGEVAEG